MPCLTVHVCMNSVKFALEAPGASPLWGRYYSVTMCRLTWMAILLGRALLIGTLLYVDFTRDISKLVTGFIELSVQTIKQLQDR